MFKEIILKMVSKFLITTLYNINKIYHFIDNLSVSVRFFSGFYVAVTFPHCFSIYEGSRHVVSTLYICWFFCTPDGFFFSKLSLFLIQPQFGIILLHSKIAELLLPYLCLKSSFQSIAWRKIFSSAYEASVVMIIFQKHYSCLCSSWDDYAQHYT